MQESIQSALPAVFRVSSKIRTHCSKHAKINIFCTPGSSRSDLKHRKSLLKACRNQYNLHSQQSSECPQRWEHIAQSMSKSIQSTLPAVLGVTSKVGKHYSKQTKTNTFCTPDSPRSDLEHRKTLPEAGEHQYILHSQQSSEWLQR